MSDKLIRDYWVDLPGGGGFNAIARPDSPLPMFIVGGKGSGKTHLMRFFSYPLQKLRAGEPLLAGVKDDGYLGIYVLCSGLNAMRFSGKGQSEDVWRSVFAYYMDLWLAESVLSVVQDVFQVGAPLELGQLDNLTGRLLGLLDRGDAMTPRSITELLATLAAYRRQIDFDVNNCGLSGRLTFPILASPGRLVFGFPEVLESSIPQLRGSTFLYLIDELENLSTEQQRYVNSLVRDRKRPSAFKIGSRTYGVRTLLTYSADEELKRNSEYEWLALDTKLRQRREYPAFARDLCLRRLQHSGFLAGLHGQGGDAHDALSDYFERDNGSSFGETETAFVISKYRDRERPYFSALRDQLDAYYRSRGALASPVTADIEKITSSLGVPAFPLLEKLNIFLFYQDWYSGKDLIQAATAISRLCRQYQGAPRSKGRYATAFRHWHADMLAQLYRECDQKQRYLGIDNFIDMSHGIPRNLLVILKNIVAVASFREERPFAGGTISIASQQEGVHEAADWFFGDARAPGEEGALARGAINRLATLFRACRFAHKPVEVSLATFSADLSRVTEAASKVIETSERWSLLISVSGGQRGKNSSRIDAKFQLNKMLSPRWDLPIARRGAVELSPGEINAIFDPNHTEEFKELLDRRVERMTAPWFGKAKSQVHGAGSLLDDITSD